MHAPIRIQIQQRSEGPWEVLGEASVDLASPRRLSAATVPESAVLLLRVYPAKDTPIALRFFVGSVLVASSVPADRVLPIEEDYRDGSPEPSWVCKGRLLADWVGQTELTVEVQVGEDAAWVRALEVDLAVAANKINAEQYAQLFRDLERDFPAVLLDVHGKTHVGLKGTERAAMSAPVAMLNRLRASIQEFDHALHLIDRRPVSRLVVQHSREQALLGQAISEATVAEACVDPSLLTRRGSQMVFREHLNPRTRADYGIPEHRVLADFGESLKAQLADLQDRIDTEIQERRERKRWRNISKEPGHPSWWEAEDLPRIEELRQCRHEVRQLRSIVESWQSHRFLPAGRKRAFRPDSTPLFRNNELYCRAFRVLASHFLAYEASLDTHLLLTRARSLPVLYEWWCASRVLQILAKGLSPQQVGPGGRASFFRELVAEKGRFTVEFAEDQEMVFTDGAGSSIRFRYQPRYLAAREADGAFLGLLDANTSRTPDISIEVFPASAPNAETPDLIIVLDAKYSSSPQSVKMAEVATKYSKIGDIRTGRVLTRQVWALTPSPAGRNSLPRDLRRFCTVDNAGFWSSSFDIQSPVNGAIQTCPILADDFDPLEALLSQLLHLSGVQFASHH